MQLAFFIWRARKIRNGEHEGELYVCVPNLVDSSPFGQVDLVFDLGCWQQ